MKSNLLQSWLGKTKMKIGRNDSCPCNSGKKYKHCHYLTGGFPFGIPTVTRIEPTPEIKHLMEEEMKKHESKRKLYEQMGIFINFVIPIHFKGKKVWALGSRVYPYQSENETFHEFIMYVLKLEFGREWWKLQKNLPEKEWHFIYKCFMKHHEWRQRNQLPENMFGKVWGAKPDGYSRTLVSLAFDVCSLMHAVHVPEVFLEKLRRNLDYQSVRYEIAVAAIFARMGYKIKFLDEEFSGQNQPKHAEFIAIDSVTNEEIVVEVKSKERGGVLHKEGEFNEEIELKSSITKLYRHAIQQRQLGKPFIIFIDMNLPLSPGVSPGENRWVSAVTRMRDEAAFATKGQKSLTNAIVFTNYSYHYGTDQETGSGEWFLEKSGNPECPIESPDFNMRFIPGIHSYGNVPNIDIDFE